MSDSNDAPDFPAVSLVLLAYNQAELVLEAARSCLAQDCPPIEIILSDDCSSDDTHDRLLVAAAAYSGPHRVTVRRNERNLGIGEHYNRLLDVAHGELIVTAAGDDVSTPDRVHRLVDGWNANRRRADLIASHVVDMDHAGRLHDVLRVDDLGRYRSAAEWLARRPYVIGAGHAFTPRMMRRFGPLAPGIVYEDQVMVLRAILSGGAITVDTPLVHYRRGGASARPVGESAEDRAKWNLRQLEPMLAEMHQLIADARVAGYAEPLEARFAVPIQDRSFALGMLQARGIGDRWRALREAPLVPMGWRLRKLLHATFPGATRAVKSFARRFKRRRG